MPLEFDYGEEFEFQFLRREKKWRIRGSNP